MRWPAPCWVAAQGAAAEPATNTVDARGFVNVSPSAGGALAQWVPDRASGEAQASCRLRYSGGSSRLPGPATEAGVVTPIGDLTARANRLDPAERQPLAAFAPPDPRKRYRQVLVQCPQGEWPDGRGMRHLFLANDVMVEVGGGLGSDEKLTIRHWRRQASPDTAPWPPALPVPPEPELAAVLARMGAGPERAAAARPRLAGGRVDDLIDLIDLLGDWRVQTRPYDSDEFPENVLLLDTADAALDPLCERLARQPGDALVRYNLTLLLRRKVRSDLGLQPWGAKLAACLRPGLEDAHPWVRAESTWALAYLARPEDRERLMARLKDADADTAREAREAVGVFEDTLKERRR